MADLIEKIGKSTIQHGKENDRIYLMRFFGQANSLIKKLDQICLENKYSKIFAKIPASQAPDFLANNYELEAFVPGFFKGQEDGFFLAKYFSKARKKIPKKDFIDLQSSIKNKGAKKKFTGSKYKIKKLKKADVPKLAAIYRKIFKNYPFPIHSEKYLLKTMRGSVVYFGAWKDGELIGAASSEIDMEFLSAEMTDFAVMPKFRGNNVASLLLSKMEQSMKKLGIKTLYTIARLKSLSVNVTFLRAGYSYSGTLIKNTNIAGGLESMNVWYKHIVS